MRMTTIVEFREAIQQAETSLLSLKGIEVEPHTLSHTRHFAECWATLKDRRVLIYAPITPQAMAYAERAAEALGATNSRALSPYTIYYDELLLRNGRRCPIIVERPLRGTPLSEMLFTLKHETLIKGLNEFCNALKACNISHNNLRVENILVDNTSAWHAIRQYYTSSPSGGDDASFEQIEALICRNAIADSDYSELHDKMASYTSHPTLGSALTQVEESGLIGFNNERGERVIECKYLWASDFAEGRSMVLNTEQRMGLIDINGREVIECSYDEVEYDPNTGQSWVLNDGVWAEFDYLGNQISGWSNEN